ncbi:hypothetical protein ABZ924_05795 [Streptomyces sp. NPDC046876]|uniref:hypothetical protein n=1 Tax=Streptomyces sp. NPDC046876 TaxID=3155616 RepID=UPI0033D236D9
MTILAEHRLLAVPDRRVIELYDADAYVGTAAVLDQLDEHVVAGDGYHLYIGSLQSGVGVEVAIRVHDAPPAMWPPADGSTELTLECATGTLIVGEFTAGVAGEVELPRPGVYRVRASWQGRESTAHQASAIRLRAVEEQWNRTATRQALDTLAGSETYGFDMWYLHEPEDEDPE